MAIQGIAQPEELRIGEDLRLRKFDGVYDFALVWYQDPELVYLVDGVKNTYTMERLTKMYHFLNQAGELYFIEQFCGGEYHPIGDVTFWQEDMPIVIGDPGCRGRGIGRRVIQTLVSRAKQLGYEHISVEEIYDWNAASRRCFESVGFRVLEKTARGAKYRLYL